LNPSVLVGEHERAPTLQNAGRQVLRELGELIGGVAVIRGRAVSAELDGRQRRDDVVSLIASMTASSRFSLTWIQALVASTVRKTASRAGTASRSQGSYRSSRR